MILDARHVRLGTIDFSLMKTVSRSASFVCVLVLCGLVGAGAAGFSGKVTETMDAGGYTYVLVDTGTNKVWAAATKFPVKQGDSVVVADAMEMKDFHSKSLNRDFPVIQFAGSIAVNGAKTGGAALPTGHPAIGGDSGSLPAGHPSVNTKPATAKLDFTGLKPVKGGKTIAEIHAASAQLEGKSVKFRGKVAKYNAGILGKNWLHVQDGSGSASSNDLLVTTLNTAKPGDTVLVEGKVALKKDFGSGYKYDLLVEEAKVVVE